MAGGKRAGERPPDTGGRGGTGRRLALHALGITATVVAWGYLAWMAIDFGRAARDDGGVAWLLLALASIGAIACLFIGLLLAAGALRTLSGPPPPGDDDPRPAGGKRAAR
ncbi:MAG TPA: hypothetical protein VGE77_03540 [Nocardioides sp.]